MEELAFTYERHKPEETILYQLVKDNLNKFFESANSNYDRKPLPEFVRREFETFLGCGLLKEGFVRVKCEDCSQEKLVPVSCKKRGFCPSCAARRMLERSFNLCDFVIPDVPVRQWVLSLPIQLRYWMASDHDLLKYVNEITVNRITAFMRKKLKQIDINGDETGAVSFLQRSGSALNLNLHFHLVFLDGMYIYNEENKDPIFYKIPEVSDEEIASVIESISKKVVLHLRKIGKLPKESEEVFIEDDNSILSHIKAASITNYIALGERSGKKVRRIGGSFGYEGEIPQIRGRACASINGFSLHAATTVEAGDREKLESLFRYVGRGSLSNERISLTENGDVLYELKNTYDGATHVLFSPLEFLEKIASLIPPPKKHLVTYYGCLSSHSSLRPLIIPNGSLQNKENTENERIDEIEKNGEIKEISGEKEEKKSPKSHYIPWQELLKRTFNIDLKICRKCGGFLRIIALVLKRDVIDKILGHLGLSSTSPPRSSILTYTEDMST